jgi:hypothetical protein
MASGGRWEDLVRKAQEAIADAAQAVLKGNPAHPVDCIFLDTQCAFFSLQAARCAGLLSSIMSTLASGE